MKYIILFTLLISPLCSAEIYQWQDKNGKIHYSDKKEDSKTAKEVILKGEEPSNNSSSFKSKIGKGINCPGSNKIISAKLVGKTQKSIFIEVEYFYDNKHSNETEITLRPVNDLYWSHESILTEPGQNTVNIKLSAPYSKKPKNISIDKIEVMMRTPRYDKKRKRTYTHKITSKLFNISHDFNIKTVKSDADTEIIKIKQKGYASILSSFDDISLAVDKNKSPETHINKALKSYYEIELFLPKEYRHHMHNSVKKIIHLLTSTPLDKEKYISEKNQLRLNLQNMLELKNI